MASITIKTIAEKLGLSIATVSRALKDSHEISLPTREKVKAAALELGYQPNVNASGLRAGSSKTIAVIVPEVENHFFSQVISGIESVARQHHYHVLIYLTHEDAGREEELVQLLGNGRADGLLISVTHNSEGYAHLNRLAERSFPLVLFDRLTSEIDVPTVSTNNEAISFQATELLAQRGAKKIAFLGLDPNLYIMRTRLDGFRNASKHWFPKLEPPVFTGTGEATVDLPKLSAFLKKVQPDAVLSASESMALLLYQIARDQQLRVPADLQLISFTNMNAVPFLSPSLSAIVQPAFAMGKEAAELLFKVIRKKNLFPAELNRQLPSEIRPGASIKAV